MSEKVFVVTGANQGIGYAIVETLAKTVDGAIIYLTARNEDLGKAALKKIEETLGSSLKSKVHFHQLNITDESSVKNFADHLKKVHGGLDVLINNAGVSLINSSENSFEKAEMTIDVNYYGTKRISHYCIPLIKEGGRLINVCSLAGILNTSTKELSADTHQGRSSKEESNHYMNLKVYMKETYSQENVDKIVNASDEKVIDEFIENFKKSVKEGNEIEAGYPTSSYRVSKAAAIALTMLHHRMYSKKGIKINACCPGYTTTNLTHYKGYLTIYDGADTPVYLAVDPNAPDGKFLYIRRAVDWY